MRQSIMLSVAHSAWKIFFPRLRYLIKGTIIAGLSTSFSLQPQLFSSTLVGRNFISAPNVAFFIHHFIANVKVENASIGVLKTKKEEKKKDSTNLIRPWLCHWPNKQILALYLGQGCFYCVHEYKVVSPWSPEKIDLLGLNMNTIQEIYVAAY